jgi:hypothetical protein
MKLEQLINEIIKDPEIKKELLCPNSREIATYDVKLDIAYEQAKASGNFEEFDLLKKKRLIPLRYKRVNVILDILEDSIQLNKIVPVRDNTGRKLKKVLEINEENTNFEEGHIES